ncbi:MAG TPA: hypothetical protein VFD92_12545 [Candidatus Binatia bacterium]|nr:hypothetical protein [Candidatus Binatia bacterium]
MAPAQPHLRDDLRPSPRDASDSAAAIGVAAAGLDDEVLADVSHELRNQFHKLYYCAEMLRAPDGDAGDVSPADLLQRTVENLEQFLTGALDYFRPVKLQRVRMSGADVGRALEAVLRSAADGARIDVASAAGVDVAMVAIDPGRISAALRAVAARLARGSAVASRAFGIDARLRRARRHHDEVLEIRIEIPARLGAAMEEKSRLVDWAIAAKVFAAHGGGLVRAGLEESPGCTVWVPLVDEDWARRS